LLGLTHGAAFGSTVDYFLAAPLGLGFVGFSGLCRAGGVSADTDVGPAGWEARVTSGGETGLGMGVGKAADGRACGRGTHGFTPMALLLGCPLNECQGYCLAEQEKN